MRTRRLAGVDAIEPVTALVSGEVSMRLAMACGLLAHAASGRSRRLALSGATRRDECDGGLP
jgi:hypothetical protein